MFAYKILTMKSLEKFRRYNNKIIKGIIYSGDAFEFLHQMKSKSVDIIFLDPPFNLGKNYTKADPGLDNKKKDEYVPWLNDIISESLRVLDRGGAFFLYHIPFWAIQFGAKIQEDLDFRHWIAISMKSGFVRNQALYPAHYALLYYSKGEPKYFHRPKLPPEHCRHCDGLVKDYGGYRNIIEQKGINLSDIWDDLSPVRHKSRKNRIQNELPMEMTNRVVSMVGQPGMRLADPFAGSGAMVLAAAIRGLRFAACDIVRRNCYITATRLEQYQNERVEIEKNV